MKAIRMLSVVALVITGWIPSLAQAVEAEVPGDNFSLEGALDLFKKSSSPEEFEKMLNSPDSKVNNLDLNGDGYIDYIRVQDRNERNVHAFIMQAVVSENEFQDIAVITLEKQANGKAVLQIVGDEDVYGIETIIEPTQEVRTYAGTTTTRTVVNVWAWPAVQYVYSPVYAGWVSPWGWHRRPIWWHTWRPVAYVHYYPIWRPYYHYYAPCYTRRVVYAHDIYSPYRSRSVIVQHRHRDQVSRYRDRYTREASYARRRDDNRRQSDYNRSRENQRTSADAADRTRGIDGQRRSTLENNRRSTLENNRRSSEGNRGTSSDRTLTDRNSSRERTLSTEDRRKLMESRDDQSPRPVVAPAERQIRRTSNAPRSLDTRSDVRTEARSAPQRPVVEQRATTRPEVQRSAPTMRRESAPTQRSSEILNGGTRRSTPSPSRPSSVERRSAPSPSPAVQRSAPRSQPSRPSIQRSEPRTNTSATHQRSNNTRSSRPERGRQ